MTEARTPSGDTRLWHPFADMATLRHEEVRIMRGEGVWVWDADGRRYLDATASLWYCNIGHGREEMADAIARQVRELETYSTFGDYANEPALELAERLSGLAPMADPRVFLVLGGGDAIDTAAKLVRRYWIERGEPQRVHIVSRTAAYHGTHGYGTSLAGIAANHDGWGPLVGATSQVAHDSADALRVEIDRLGAENVAAFFFEPVIGAGGVYPPVDGYIEEVAAVCREAGVLLVADEVICAFGRLGHWFGIERWGVEPDLLTFAKGVTSGYLPVGGVIVSGRVAEPFWAPRDGGPTLRHGPTYAGHATCCAAALTNLDILEREALVVRGAELEGELLAALAPLAEHPLVAEVRGGVGLLGAIELVPELLADNPTASFDLYRLAREHGVLVRAAGTAVAVSPPLTVTGELLELIPEALRAGLDRLQEGS